MKRETNSNGVIDAIVIAYQNVIQIPFACFLFTVSLFNGLIVGQVNLTMLLDDDSNNNDDYFGMNTYLSSQIVCYK